MKRRFITIKVLLVILNNLGSKYNELESVETSGQNDQKVFVKNRDLLERKYKEKIGQSIKREREHQKEVLKKSTAHAAVSSFRKNPDDDLKKQLLNEEISDRTPILDILIEKWKYFNKSKKHMLDKYSKNAVGIKETLNRLMKYLGIEKYEDLPILLEKMEDQMSNIEIFISKLTIHQNDLEDHKRHVEFKIKDLQNKTSENSNYKERFISDKKERIQNLRKHIEDFKHNIEDKKALFTALKPITDDFLIYMQNTYVSNYIPLKIAVNSDVWYNENNIMEIFANVQDYIKVSQEITLNKDSPMKRARENENAIMNKELEKLKFEMRNRIEHLKETNHLQNSVKDRLNTSFDETIKKLSEELIKGMYSRGGDKDTSLNRSKKKDLA